ncbi:MAG: response regulator [Rikenellaceae bacterium]|jgi:signal transduction histidine kinase/ligand-binding sensor domain-containing protein/DNA-binding response OmpR family regulator|nr:response regulator [Rikenellaceae bacterium]
MQKIAIIVLIFICQSAAAQNIRQTGSRDGLSNSAVICLFQDSERYLWMGTYDGLNRYDGTDIRIYKPNPADSYSLSGNVIRKIVESRDNSLWIMTKGGLNLFSKRKDRVEAHFSQFKEDCAIACDSRDNFFILTQEGHLYYYDFERQEIVETEVPNLRPTSNWVGLIIDRQDRAWITNNGVARRYAIVLSGDGRPQFEWLGNFDHPHAIAHIYYDRGRLIIVDSRDDLFTVEDEQKSFVRNLSPLLGERRDISSMVFDGGDLVVGFRSGGAVRLKGGERFAVEKLPVNCGVFSLLKDDVQDILWIGSDGQGAYAMYQEKYRFNGVNLEELPLKTQRPVRAIFSDRHGALWLGTKGDGIIKIDDYERGLRNVEHLTVDNGLSNNSIFAFTDSRANNVLWIGSSGPGLNYYSYDDRKVHTLKTDPSVNFVEVHSILETSGALWVSSLFSLFRMDIRRTGSDVEARNVRRYDFDLRDKQGFNKIYAICPENDSIMWLAMRGNGAIRFNSRNGNYSLTTFDDNGFAPVNDILCIHNDAGGELWFGSSYGVNRLSRQADGNMLPRNYCDTDGLSNNTIHGILESGDGNLWFSSNAGLILFDRNKNTFHNFNRKAGLKVIEFSDNAYYRDAASSKCFFGGIDGVVWIESGQKRDDDFVPPLFFTGLRILNEEVNMDDFLVRKGGRESLRLRYNQNFFTVSFSVVDFIGGTDKKFSCFLENFSQTWMTTGTREMQFGKIPPGRYVLRVRYDDEYGRQSNMASLNIEILSPWWFGLWAKLFYALAAAALLLYAAKKYRDRRRRMELELARKYREEMYENKLRFFTNITHEFCTPLTLIHTPSERIFNYAGSDDYVRKYAQIIRSNSERLNTLIQEIIDFRRMETGNKVCKIERRHINAVCGEIMEAFADLAEENALDFSLEIEGDITWNTDLSCITTILNNLTSNAFKYTQPQGEIKITVGVEGDCLMITVHNSGKGIREEDIPRMFNRYSVLDNVERNMIRGLSSRNGLGLAICKSLVELLGGSIGVESERGRYAKFIVRLPQLELPETASVRSAAQQHDAPPRVHDENTARNPNPRARALIIDDNEEILWMLKEILAEDYTVLTARDGAEGIERLAEQTPDVIITDVMMPERDGISMTRQIKLNPHTMHIPIIIISAKSSTDDRIEGIESGADAYIPKPFDAQYLKTVARQLIVKHGKLKEYYNSSASAHEYLDGQLLPKEGREFIRSVVQTIDRNIGEVEFNVEELADNLNISLRTLYRRFKELGLPAPKDFLRRQRIEYAAKLLISTNHTVQEIMYSAGFNTRSHFFKEFVKRYNQSPKEYRAAGISMLEEL